MNHQALLILAFIASASCAFGQHIVLTCETPVEIYNNQVGHEWRFGFGVNKTFYPAFEPVEAPLGSASTIEFIMQELDKQTDQSTVALDIDPSKLEYNKQYSKKLEVTVTENGGRYKGNKAMFTVMVYYKKVATRV